MKNIPGKTMKATLTKQFILTALLFAVPPAVMAQTPVFTDHFSSGSTTNGISIPGGTPTASSTSYDIASPKTATNLAPAGHLKIGLSAATGSGYFEAQALFAGTPVTLATVGDYINFSYTFTNSANLLAGGIKSAIFIGLYNSGGVAPLTNLANAGLYSATAGALPMRPATAQTGRATLQASPRAVEPRKFIPARCRMVPARFPGIRI